MRKAFTLIELLLACGLIAAMLGVGMAAFRTSSRKQAVDSAVTRLRQTLRQAKANAQAGKKDCRACGAPGPNYSCGTGDVDLDGWRVTFSGSSYALEGVCGAVSFGSRAEAAPVGVSIAGGATITFYTLGSGASANATITLSDTFGNSGAVVVNTAGDIQ